MPSFIASGAITVSGCAKPINVTRTYSYDYKFDVGSSAYILSKAKKGVMSKIAVKRRTVATFSGTTPELKYTDTTNEVWFEEELVTQAEAAIYAAAAILAENEREARFCPSWEGL